jgi:hypothetical protein
MLLFSCKDAIRSKRPEIFVYNHPIWPLSSLQLIFCE